MSKIELLHGDCLELMKDIPDGSVDLILCDPPYGTTVCKWDTVIPFEPMWAELKRVIKPNGAICLFGSEPFSSALRMSNIKQFKYDWYWHKTKSPNFLHARKMPHFKVETCSVFYKKLPIYNYELKESLTGYKVGKSCFKERSATNTHKNVSGQKNAKLNYSKDYKEGFILPDNLLKFSNYKTNKTNYHPTQKPTALLEYLIRTYTLECETVLDFTMGSGSTGVAAKNLNRNFIGIELDEQYFNIAKERIENAQPEPPKEIQPSLFEGLNV